jgi:hypothetical protein
VGRTVDERCVDDGTDDGAGASGLDGAIRAERPDLDVGAVGEGGGDRSEHVRSGFAFDERLDRELDVDHHGKDTASRSRSAEPASAR